ncbi:hypothetical protein D3C74_50620 [compost metagenome]
MDILTEKQLKEIEKIVNSHVGVMLNISSGKGSPDPNLLRKLGIPENAPSMIQNAFVLGKIVKSMNESELSKMTFDELKEKVKAYVLSPVERNSLRYAENNAARYVTSLGQSVVNKVDGAINHSSQQANLEVIQQGIIRDKVAQAILNQNTKQQLASELGHTLIDDWKRDWQRIAHTEIWNAKLQGEVVAILQGEAIYSNTEGGDTQVFRRPSPDACNHCKRLYLESDGVTPKVFSLSELIANGTNVGKKVIDWRPITGTTHPNCTCPIAVLPRGFGFDKKGYIEFKD